MNLVKICMVFLIFSVALGEQHPGAIEDWATVAYAFNTKINTDICNKETRIISLDPSITDYAPIINSELASLHANGGGSIQLESGTYHHTGQITMPSKTCILGFDMNSTTLKLNDNSPEFSKAGNIRSRSTQHITVANITIDGNRANQVSGQYGLYGFYSHACDYIFMERVTIRNNDQFGFDPHGNKDDPSNPVWGKYLVIDKCHSENNGKDGYTIDMSAYVTVTSSTAQGNDRHGFNVVTGSEMVSIRDCSASNNGISTASAFAVVVQNNQGYGTNRVAIVNCYSNNNNKGSVKLNDVNNIIIKDSSFINPESDICYEFKYTQPTVVLDNNYCYVRSDRKFKLTLPVHCEEINPIDEFSDGATTATLSCPTPGPSPSLASSPTSSPSPDPTTNPQSGPGDPHCHNGTGIRARKDCCDLRCVKCGGSGCGSQNNGPGKEYCCRKKIRRSCSAYPVPCELDEDPDNV